MLVNVNFTVDIDTSEEYRDALIEFTAADDLAGVRLFVVGESAQYILDYLSQNGAKVSMTPASIDATGVEGPS